MRFLKGAILAASAFATNAFASETVFEETTEQASYAVTEVASGMTFPWDMQFLPGGDILISEYDGSLRIVRDGVLDPEPIAAIDDTTERGGLRGIALHPDFKKNRLVYFCYASGTAEENHTRIARGRFDGASVEDVEVIFAADNAARQLAHYGCRLLWTEDGKLLATLGDRRHHADASQDRSDHYGVILRLNDDGTAPEDNPFYDEGGAAQAIYAYGIRNAQGAVFHPATGDLWIAEHGPLGGDEVNIIRAGENYGWPIATFGIDYSGEKLTDTPLLEGVTAPLYYWYPSIAPSSIAFYDGEEFPKWRGDIFITTLASQRLLRLELNGDRVLRVEELFAPLQTRLRNVEMGPDGALYVLTDAGDGRLLRIEPKKPE